MLLLPALAWAGPPFITDDPEPVEYTHWEINYAVSGTWSKSDINAGLPSIDINYGFSPDVQLHVQPKYAYEKNGSKKFGVDNTEIGIKYRFMNVESGDSTFMVSIYPIVQLPMGNNKLGPGRDELQAFFPIWIQHDTEHWTFYGGTGYRINQAINSRNSIFVGATALYKLTKDLQLGGEVFNETASEIGNKGASGFNLGGIYNLTDDYHLLFSAGKGLSNISATNQFSAYMALQVIY